MKRKNQLQLDKKVIIGLSHDNQKRIIGGQQQINEGLFTTSFFDCTNVLCCEPGPTTSKTIIDPTQQL